MEVSKRDWKLYRDKIGSWQELYMERLIKEYADLLNEDQPASSKFWALEERIKSDKKKPGVKIELSKRDMIFDLIRLMNDGVISMDDLVDFSDELVDSVKFLQKRI